MLQKITKEELCQISLTGIRSLVLLDLLIKAPRSLEEIREAFINYNIMEDSNSDDILRIDINTLRTMGCEISRADHRTNNKYVLINHPFKINLENEEINVVKRAFNEIKKDADITLLMSYDALFRKIAEHIADNNVKEMLLGISPLKKYSTEIIDELIVACNNKKEVKLTYKSPTTNKIAEKDIYAEKIVLQNDKLYFYGIDKNTKEQIYLNIKRILKILSQSDSDENVTVTPITIKFVLKDFGISGLEDNEEIISGNAAENFVVVGRYHNSFLATQRILSFGSKCTVLEPEDFKRKIIEILKRMKDIYNGKA